MSVRPVDMGGFMQNQHNYSTIKHSEDQRPAIEQQFAHNEGDKKAERALHKVNDKGEAEKNRLHYDAKDGSNNKYKGNQNKKKNKQDDSNDTLNNKKYPTSTFDITI